jgi:ABC-type amino acid transport substrate-binding protein
VIALSAPLVMGQDAEGPIGTLDRIRATGRMRLGYRLDARPLSYRDESGQPAGYSVELCRRIEAAVKQEPGLAATNVEWVPVTSDARFDALAGGQVALLCGAETETLGRRAGMSFSLPTFPGGIGVLVRSDAPVRLLQVLSGRGQIFRPTWRASATQVLQARAFSAIAGTTSGSWLNQRIQELQVIADVRLVGGFDAGVQAVLERKSDAFFAERAVLLDAARRHPSARDLTVVPRQFTYEPLALAFERGDEDFRLFVDRVLSRLYTSGEFGELFTKWFGEPDEPTLTFFRWNVLPD